jgi:hypothetical protein
LSEPVIFEIKTLTFAQEPIYNEENEILLTLKFFDEVDSEMNATIWFVRSPGIQFLDSSTTNYASEKQNVILSKKPIVIRQKILLSELGPQAINAVISSEYLSEFEKLYLVVEEDSVKYDKFPFEEHKPIPLP